MLHDTRQAIAPALHELLSTVSALRDDILAESEELYHSWQSRIERSAFVPSAQNLAAYLALRRRDLLWLCAAAHVPVIWATQVLENLAKEGVPSRAEVTDAAMAVRAECVMLNKGPFITEAVQLLDDVLTRMLARQQKKPPSCAPYTPGSVSLRGKWGSRRCGRIMAVRAGTYDLIS